MIDWRSATDDHSTAITFVASWLMHALLIGGLWLVGTSVVVNDDPGGGQGHELTATIEDGSFSSAPRQLGTDVESVITTNDTNAVPSSSPTTPFTAVRSRSALAEIGTITVAPPNLDMPSTEAMPSQFTDWRGISLAEEIGGSGFGSEIGTGIGTGTGDGIGDAIGDGEGAEGKFFGLGAKVSSYVFVVDASGSMGRPYPPPALNRFNRVKLELIRTIGSMSPEQKFFIIFFNSDMLAMPANHLIPAEPIFQREYLEWMAQVPHGGDTEPEEALVAALSLEPDVIYFLTDGEFAYRVTETVERHNTSDIPIHTIGFGDNEGERWLLKIADESGGEYQFITQENDAMLNPPAE